MGREHHALTCLNYEITLKSHTNPSTAWAPPDRCECKRLGTCGPEQVLIPGAAFVCTLISKNVPCSFRKILMFFHTSPGSDLCPTQTQGFSRGN